MKDGDKNTTFFHKVIKGRKQRNRIESICDEKGERFYGEDVPDQFVKHFQQFLGTERKVQPMVDCDHIFTKQLSSLEANEMIKEVTSEEIKSTMFDIKDDKATGPDGFTSCFFKKAWSIVGMDICKAIKEFFHSGKLLKEVNATIISLIPKMNTPNKVSDFRPIACCNVLYKCISKVLTNRIKKGLEKVVSSNQSAFIPGRSIQDNILLTQELLKGYNRKNGPKRCALKIDLQKAYDTVSWSFLESILGRFGFPEKMVKWIMTCITSSAFSICVNGQAYGYFKGARGLRQGDPISPYLFTLVMEVPNLIISKNIKSDGRFMYHKGCKDLQLTHLCFADDLMIFCNGDLHSISVIKESLKEFSNYSGLHPNMNKSTIFFGGNVMEPLKGEILKAIPFSIGKLPMKYLKVPLLAKCLGISDCKQLVDKVKDRIGDWKNRFLSYAERLQLISSVLASLHTYWASVYLIPKVVVNEIDKTMKTFLWSHGGGNNGRAKVAWKVVC
ncbi:RNA-directed DNA polymerase, eukaryota, reverse transcriptase zinc-binding domain protein, partial [Tanacetum coccineum]